MSLILPFIFAAVCAYLFGSISSSVIITKIATGTDIRKHGSGNAGATNVLRTAGKLPAVITFLCDFLKCIFAVLVAVLFAKIFNMKDEYIQLLKYTCGIFCMIGHIYPVFFGFKGGKGVTVAAAIMLLLDWRCFIIGISVFIIIVLVTRLVSLGSVLSSLTLPFLTIFFQTIDRQPYAVADTLLVSIISAIIIFKHRVNIVRLINGTEPKIKSKK